MLINSQIYSKLNVTPLFFNCDALMQLIKLLLHFNVKYHFYPLFYWKNKISIYIISLDYKMTKNCLLGFKNPKLERVIIITLRILILDVSLLISYQGRRVAVMYRIDFYFPHLCLVSNDTPDTQSNRWVLHTKLKNSFFIRKAVI